MKITVLFDAPLSSVPCLHFERPATDVDLYNLRERTLLYTSMVEQYLLKFFRLHGMAALSKNVWLYNFSLYQRLENKWIIASCSNLVV